MPEMIPYNTSYLYQSEAETIEHLKKNSYSKNLMKNRKIVDSLSINIRSVEDYYALKDKYLNDKYLEEYYTKYMDNKQSEEMINREICYKEFLLTTKQKIYRDKKSGKVYCIKFGNTDDSFVSQTDKYQRLDTLPKN